MMRLSSRLPDFPWDSLRAARDIAAAHPDGIVDLSVGTPVDPVPQLAREALAAASDAHGYPTVWGTATLRQAIQDYFEQRWCSVALSERNVIPVVGTKELVAWLPSLLGLGPAHSVVYPSCAYPTYQVGARTASAKAVALDDPAQLPADTALIWLNSPSNPTGRIAPVSELRDWVAAARELSCVIASDECYGEFGWEQEPVSVLDPRVNDGDLTGLLAVSSLSKRSNAAGYRMGMVVGDPELVMELVASRKHLGMMVPTPVQAAMTALLADQEHVAQQRGRYLARRASLMPALQAAGFRIDDSQGSLYLWATRDESCRDSLYWLAERGILVAPGDFYGSQRHVRVALTATDERVAAAVNRLVG